MKRILFLLTLCISGRSFAQPSVNEAVLLPAGLRLAKKELSAAPAMELKRLIESKTAGTAVLGYSKNHQPIEAYYFPGTSDQKALVIGGVHGSELSSVETARKIIQELRTGERPYFQVIIVPELFPDNADEALTDIKGAVNKGRYTSEAHADPNRQMPPLGRSFDPQAPFDSYGRPIEKENQMLLKLIQDYKPSRIANLHAIRDEKRAGIYADPRTDCRGYALGFDADSSLAVGMARIVFDGGGDVPGNCMDEHPSALYYNDPCTVEKGALQKRNLHGSALPNNRGYGVSLGSWASTAVCDGRQDRDAMILLTLEFPGYKTSSQQGTAAARERCLRNVNLFAKAVVEKFLSEK